jgi:hypothetical protein
MKVRKGMVVKYDPCGWDVFDAKTDLTKGDTVRVCHPYGCPAPNTMGCCHVETLEGKFKGLVSTNSLSKP